MKKPIIWHNPRCGTSRNTLAAIEQVGYSPIVIEYLKNPPNITELTNILDLMGMKAENLCRVRGADAAALAAFDEAMDERGRIAAMCTHPILIERPIVQFEGQALLCRPKEKLIQLIPTAQF